LKPLSESSEKSYELHGRLREHSRSLEMGEGLSLEDFQCRMMILEDAASDLIGTVEAALIRNYRPLWNSLIDGFGNHDPGSGRYEQAKSDWDVCHPGRLWAEKCQEKHRTQKQLATEIQHFIKNLIKGGSNDKNQ